MKSQIINDITQIIKTNTSIGIFVSGGVDSAVMSYMVHYLRKAHNTNNSFEFFTVPKYDNSLPHAKNVISYIDNIYNNRPSNHHIVGDPTSHHTMQGYSSVLYALNNYTNDMFMVGDTKNPDSLPDGPVRKQGSHARIHRPFLNCTKDNIIRLALDFQLMDLIKICHTCTESPDIRCGKCWQCRERAWAFAECGYTDPGVL